MIDRKTLLADLQRLLRDVEADLLERSESAEVPAVGAKLREDHAEARKAERTAQTFEAWRADAITQTAAAWVLSVVFVRFLEDNGLIDAPKISGPGDRLKRARDEHELYFRAHPALTDRDYLLSAFDGLTSFAATREVFGPHNPIRDLPNWPSGDAANRILGFFQEVDPNTGTLAHDFTDPAWDTRFLGDLYQDLSEAARKKYALLQTPAFVEAFILDRTLDPAIEAFGLARPGHEERLEPDGRLRPDDRFRMIDPACGSGHFLLGSFARLVDRWRRREPGTRASVLVQRALDSVHGVDLNPFAIAIARFRLLVAALRECDVRRLKDAPGFAIHLACGDSLLHGASGGDQATMGWASLDHAYQPEDRDILGRMLRSGSYHAVMANPPYITPKDRALNEAYRGRYKTCHMKYSLAVPFLERIVGLAAGGGFTGQITANSFMKREFGKKLIEEFFPRVDLTHVVDASGAYIPGHGTPTVILFIRNQPPVASTIRTVMGIRGEPTTPDDPSRGLVWSAIVDQIDHAGSQSAFVSVGDSPRALFGKHPWSIGGGGAAELKEQLEETKSGQLSDVADIGVGVVTLEDDAYQLDQASAVRSGIPTEFLRGFVTGDTIRDWGLDGVDPAVFPHEESTFEPMLVPLVNKRLWLLRTGLLNRLWFRKTMPERGVAWFVYGHISVDKFRSPLSITFAFVATHNHFVLDRGGKVFNRSAPVIKLPPGATEEDHLALLGLLNSSTACFWMKQVTQVKTQTTGMDPVPWQLRREFDGTKLQQLPIPKKTPVPLARQLDGLALDLAKRACDRILSEYQESLDRTVTPDPASTRKLSAIVAEAREAREHIRGVMRFLQEELDWQYYECFDLCADRLCYSSQPFPIQLGQRAFEFLLARGIASGESESTWFEYIDILPRTELPAEWPQDYQDLVRHRMELIATNPNIALIEQPEYKRRWNAEPWEGQLERALRSWLLDRLESYFDFDGRMNDDRTPTARLPTALVSVGKLADAARRDGLFHEVGALYRDDEAFDVERLVAELVESESVPLLPALRYKPSGLRKRREWEQTWDLQRREDAIDARTRLPKDHPRRLSEFDAAALKKEEVGDVPVPPKYASADFLKPDFWRLRGKLDVPKERWTSFPFCEGEDGTLMVAWAGFDHLQLARAVSAHYVDVQERLGGRDDPRLVPLLAGLVELLPWLKQWHNDVDPEFGVPMGDYFEGFLQEESRNLGLTLDQIRAWEPPAKPRGRRRASG